VRRAPGLPCALCFEGKFLHSSGASRREIADSHSRTTSRNDFGIAGMRPHLLA